MGNNLDIAGNPDTKIIYQRSDENKSNGDTYIFPQVLSALIYSHFLSWESLNLWCSFSSLRLCSVRSFYSLRAVTIYILSFTGDTGSLLNPAVTYVVFFLLHMPSAILTCAVSPSPLLLSNTQTRSAEQYHVHCCCCCLVANFYPTLWDSMGSSLPGSSVHGILQARILQWVASSFSRGSPQPRDQTCGSGIGRQILYHWVTWV